MNDQSEQYYICRDKKPGLWRRHHDNFFVGFDVLYRTYRTTDTKELIYEYWCVRRGPSPRSKHHLSSWYNYRPTKEELREDYLEVLVGDFFDKKWDSPSHLL